MPLAAAPLPTEAPATKMTPFKTNVRKHLSQQHATLLAFWTGDGQRPQASIENHCDMVYSLFLLGDLDDVSPSAVDAFCELAAKTRLPGWKTTEVLEEGISVHNCAYLFGTLNLLGTRFPGLYAKVLAGRTFHLAELADPQTLRPVFSAKWAHHNWRVSHWIGGVPSILVSLEANVPHLLPRTGLAASCRDAVDALMDPRTGLLRAYRSDLLQKMFRIAYGLRHAPDLGDMGGVAHVLWVDHVMRRRYMAVEAIRAEASRLLLGNSPFMEKVPYCLDFDIIQALRTAAEQSTPATALERDRARALMRSIEAFFENPSEGYTLHKIPGALATHHECALLVETSNSPASGGEPLDVIKAANWL